MKISNIEPLSFTAGETVEWKQYIDNYHPKDGWALSYSFRNFESQFDAAAIPKSDHYLIRLTSEQTSDYKAGTYWWQLTATKGKQWKVISEGTIEVKPNLSLLDSYDGRSHVKQVLDALEATILSKASRDQLSYSISGRSLSRLSPVELLKWRDVYKAEYARELQQLRISQGLGNNNIIKIRFNNS